MTGCYRPNSVVQRLQKSGAIQSAYRTQSSSRYCCSSSIIERETNQLSRQLKRLFLRIVPFTSFGLIFHVSPALKKGEQSSP